MESGLVPVLTLPRTDEGLQIENGDIVIHAVAGKAAAEIAGDGDAVDAVGAGNGPNHFVGGGVDDFGLGGVGNVEAMIGAIDINVVPPAGAADLDFAHDLVSGWRSDRGHAECQQQEGIS